MSKSDVTQNWTIHKAKIELEPMISGRVCEISQREYYDAMTYGSGINWFYDRQGGPSISLEDMITGDIEYTTTYEVFGAPGTYSVSMGGFALKDTFDKNYELVITDGEFTVTEVMVNITAQYLNEYNEILDEDGNKLEFDNGGLTLLFGREYTLSIVLPASHNRSNYTLQCSGTDVPKVDIVNNQYTFRVINDSNFFVINVTENKYFIKCYDDDKTTVIYTMRDRGHGTSLENNTEFGFAEVGIQSYIDYKSYRDKKYNYTFVEWRNLSDDTRADFTNLTDDHYVYLYCTTTLDEYSITIPDNVKVFKGSAIVTDTTKLNYEDEIIITYEPSEGCEMTEFTVTGAEATSVANTYVVTGDVVITYEEDAISYTIVVYNNVNSDVLYETTVQHGEYFDYTPTIPDDLEYHYTFVEYLDENDETFDYINTPITRDMVLYAMFMGYENYYYITCDSENNVVVYNEYGDEITLSTGLLYGSEISIEYVETEGYRFVSMTVEGAERVGSTNKYIVRGNITIIYVEEEIPYNNITDITTSKAGYTIALADGTSMPSAVEEDVDSISFTITINTGYEKDSNIKLYVSNSETGIVSEDNLVTPVNNVYTINITGDVYFYVDGVVKNIYTVVVYENIYGEKVYEGQVEHGDYLDLYLTVPDMQGVYFWFGFYEDEEKNLFEADSVPITRDITLTAMFYGEYYTYHPYCNSPNVIIYNADMEEIDSSYTLYYGDEITIIYNETEGYQLNDITMEGLEATSKPNTYIVVGNIDIRVDETRLEA